MGVRSLRLWRYPVVVTASSFRSRSSSPCCRCRCCRNNSRALVAGLSGWVESDDDDDDDDEDDDDDDDDDGEAPVAASFGKSS